MASMIALRSSYVGQACVFSNSPASRHSSLDQILDRSVSGPRSSKASLCLKIFSSNSKRVASGCTGLSSGLTGAVAADASGIAASARTVPPAAALAAVERKLRRVGSTGITVLFSELAWGMGLSSLLGVRAGAEVD